MPSQPMASDARDGVLPRRPQPGERLLVRIDALHGSGAGVATVVVGNPPATSTWRIEVPGALPGEDCEVVVGRAGRRAAETRLESLLVRSPDRVPEPCPHAGPLDASGRGCGGCVLQHMAPERQADFKFAQLQGLLAGIELGGTRWDAVQAVEPRHRGRNKMEFSFADDRDRRPALGLHPAGFRYEVIDLAHCLQIADDVVRLVRAAAEWRVRTGAPAFDARKSRGWLRTLGVRAGLHSGFRGLELGCDDLDDVELEPSAPAAGETGPAADPGVAPRRRDAAALADDFAHAMRAFADREGLRLDAIWWSRHRVRRGEPSSCTTVALAGPLHWHETVPLAGRPDLQLSLHPRAFFQPHSGGAVAIYGLVRALVAAAAPARVLDLYCGVGSIGLAVADLVEELVGVELVPEAVDMARLNAAANGVRNATFWAGDAAAVMAERALDVPGRFDLIIVDPPRAGLFAAALRLLVQAAPERIVYVSCNPASLQRDLALLLEAGWRAESLTPVDQFPETAHLEVVVSLRRDVARAAGSAGPDAAPSPDVPGA